MKTEEFKITKGESKTLIIKEENIFMKINVDENTNLTIYDIQIGTENIEKNIEVNINGANAKVEIFGLCILNENTKNKTKITVNHMVGNSESTQIYRSILDNKSRSDFEGKIYVAKDADGTIATQESKNILLSDTSIASMTPSLEIYSEDVKCSHGATSGQLDPEALFYMRSRGIDTAKAKELLTYAFAKEIIDKINSESFKEEIDKKIKRKLEKSCLHIYS